MTDITGDRKYADRRKGKSVEPRQQQTNEQKQNPIQEQEQRQIQKQAQAQIQPQSQSQVPDRAAAGRREVHSKYAIRKTVQMESAGERLANGLEDKKTAKKEAVQYVEFEKDAANFYGVRPPPTKYGRALIC